MHLVHAAQEWQANLSLFAFLFFSFLGACSKEFISLMLKWFKSDLFKWVDQPPCHFCSVSCLPGSPGRRGVTILK
jgi:hypothetical protein